MLHSETPQPFDHDMSSFFSLSARLDETVLMGDGAKFRVLDLIQQASTAEDIYAYIIPIIPRESADGLLLTLQEVS